MTKPTMDGRIFEGPKSVIPVRAASLLASNIIGQYGEALLGDLFLLRTSCYVSEVQSASVITCLKASLAVVDRYKSFAALCLLSLKVYLLLR